MKSLDALAALGADMKTLDKKRGFGFVFGGDAVYEQDGAFFDANGEEVGASDESSSTAFAVTADAAPAQKKQPGRKKSTAPAVTASVTDEQIAAQAEV